MIGYAQALASLQQLENLTFHRSNLRALPLDFPDHCFDCINARFLVSFLLKDDWPGLIGECLRLLRPGGILRLTECDRAARTTSPAFETLQQFILLHCYQQRRSFEPADMGVTIRLPQLLRQAGCRAVQVQAHVIEWSMDTPAWSLARQNFEVGYSLMQPHLVHAGIVTKEQWSVLWEQAQREFYAPDFGAFWQFVSIWGQKAVALG